MWNFLEVSDWVYKGESFYFSVINILLVHHIHCFDKVKMETNQLMYLLNHPDIAEGIITKICCLDTLLSLVELARKEPVPHTQ